MDRSWFKEALFSGMTSNAFKLGTVLTLGWFWSRVVGCSVLYRGPSIEQIDFANILTVAELNSVTISPPTYIPNENGCTYFYVVRRVNSCGYQERTLSAAVKVSIDSEGNLTKPPPNKIYGWAVEQVEVNRIRLIWYYCPIEQKSKPACFRIYGDAATGQVNYENPIATIAYRGRKFYSYTSDSPIRGTYLFVIRTEDANGVEDGSLGAVKIQLEVDSPDVIEVLSVEAV